MADADLELALDVLLEELGAGLVLGQRDFAAAEIGLGLLRVGANAVLGVFHPADRTLNLAEFDADLLHLLLGHHEGFSDLGGAGLLIAAFHFQRGNLLGPHFHLLLTLHQNPGELVAAAFHVGDAAVEHLDLLAAVGEVKAGLAEVFALHVAVGAQLGDARFHFVDAGATGFDGGVRIGERGAGALKPRLRLVALGFEALQLRFHAIGLGADLLE